MQALSPVEQEVLILNAVLTLVDNMVNHQILQIQGAVLDANVIFKGPIEQDYFFIFMADFLSRPNKEILGTSEFYTKLLQQISENPKIVTGGNVAPLHEEVLRLSDWLEGEISEKIWLPSIFQEPKLTLKRKTILHICGTASKHNFSRLNGIAQNLEKIFKNQNSSISFEEALRAIEDFENYFSDLILPYQANLLVEMLNNIRFEILDYLRPEYEEHSEKLDNSSPPTNQYTYPSEVKQHWPRFMYWELMNRVAKGPYFSKFKITSSFTSSY